MEAHLNESQADLDAEIENARELGHKLKQNVQNLGKCQEELLYGSA